MRRSVLRCSTGSCPVPLHSGPSGLHHVDAVDARQVYSGDTLQFAAEIEA
jgi:hypothetical protein